MSIQISVVFSPDSPPQITGDMISVANHYDVDDRLTNLTMIEKLITHSDVSAAKTLDNGNQLKWNLTFKDGQIKTRRFSKITPMLFRSRAHDQALYRYQKQGIDWLRQNPKSILADDMGLGKTLQVIKACEGEIYENKKQVAFIFCPNALTQNWLYELHKWFNLASATRYQPGSLNNMINSHNFIIINYSQMSPFIKDYASIKLDHPSIAVFDEAHKLRNQSAQISNLSRYFNTSIKWLLTGTPLERDQKDIATIVSILDPGIHVGNIKLDEFLIKSRFQKLTLRRTKDHALNELPPLHRYIHYVDMTQEQKQKYKDLIIEYKSKPPKEQIGVLTKLMIAASDQDKCMSPKYSMVLNIINKKLILGEKSIVFSRFNTVLEKLSTVLANNGINNVVVNGKLKQQERDNRIKRFQTDPNYNVLIINLSVGSEGLTLTEANNVFFINEAWNPSMNRQAEDRVNRIGQHKPVEVHIFRANNSIDITLEKILLRKEQLEDEYVDLLLGEIFP